MVRSSRRATGPSRSRSDRRASARDRAAASVSSSRQPAAMRAFRSAALSASGPVSTCAPVGGSSRASTSAATAATSRGSIHAIRPSPVGITKRPRRRSPSCRSSTDVKNDGWSTVEASGELASRRSIARWLPCSPSSSPGIGMFEIFTMCSTPARSAASMPLVSIRTCSRVGELRRNTRHAPANARSRESGSPRSAVTSSTPSGRGVSMRRLTARTATSRASELAHDLRPERARSADHDDRHPDSLPRPRSTVTRCASPDPDRASAESLPFGSSSRARCASSPTRAGERTSTDTSRGRRRTAACG